MSLIYFGLLNFACNIYVVADSAGCTDIDTACTTVPKDTCRDANFRIVCQHYCGCPEPSTLSQMSSTREEITTTKPLTTETTQPLTMTTQMVAESTTMEVSTVNHTSAVDSGECNDIYTDCNLVMQTAGLHPCNMGYVRDGCKKTCGLCLGKSPENITVQQETSTSSNLQTTKQLNHIPMTSPTVTAISPTTTPSSGSLTVGTGKENAKNSVS